MDERDKVAETVARLRKWGEGASLVTHFLGTKSAREDCAEAADLLEAFAARLAEAEAQRDAFVAAIVAIERLAASASIASCTCHAKTPDITFHSGDCRYVLLQYIIAQCEDARR